MFRICDSYDGVQVKPTLAGVNLAWNKTDYEDKCQRQRIFAGIRGDFVN